MLRRFKARKARRSAASTRRTWIPRKHLVLELLEDRLVFSSASIIAENALPGTPQSVWDVDGSGSANIQGFAAQFSINHGQTQQFKVDTDTANYHLDIYRMGYYGGDGARYITTVHPTSSSPVNQPSPITDLSTGLVDCGNWSVSASWAIPADAVSGVYIAKLVRDDGVFGESHIIFVVRADESHSDMVFKTADSTWQAYNDYGGSSLYGTDLGPTGRSYEVSYNRPFTTRDRIAANFYFGAEFAMTEYLEQNGYDVTYVASMDLDRNPGLLLNHQIFLSVGHDEYWSAGERNAVVDASNAGVNLAFFSGNEMFWKTYYAPSIDGKNTPYTTLVCYKETFENAITDSDNPNIWTGTWRDPRFAYSTDGGQPENAVTGQLFVVNGDGTIGNSITVTAADASLRFWRNTSVAKLTGNQTATLGDYVLGYEWDADVDNGYRPAGLFGMSSTTLNVSALIQDYGTLYAPGTATHSLTMYRTSSGALVFGAGTIQYSWGLSSAHDGPGTSPDKAMQQATVNLFADMGVQPGKLMSGLVAATKSTDYTAPTSVITSIVNNAVLTPGVPVTIKGTATDTGGGVVAGVEISVDGGTTWHPTTGTNSWSYTFTPRTTGQLTIVCRAVDDSGNLENATSKVTVNPNLNPGIYSLWNATTTPGTADSGDGQAVTVGMQFRSDVDAFVTGINFYKSANNTGTHIASLWDSQGNLIATATFTNETASGWQKVTFSSPVQVHAGEIYTATYYAPNGHYSADRNYFQPVGADNGPLHAVSVGPAGSNGVFAYGKNVFPTQSYQSTNYWVDVVLNTAMALDTTAPVVSSIDVAGNASNPLTTDSSIVIKFNEPLNVNSITSSTVTLINTNTTSLPSGCCGTPSGWCSGCPLALGAKTTVVTTTLNYDPINYTITLTPNSPLSTSSLYTVQVKGGTGGVTDLANNSVTTDTARSFITPAQPASVVSTIWPSTTTPATVDSGDGQGIELGMKFVATANGTISGIRFYKSAANTGVHTGSLWSSTGQLLATGTFSNETASGWQQLNFTTPITITAGTTYVASYHTTTGHYSVTRSAFTSAFTSGLLQVPANGGVYLYGAGGFPTATSQSSNYWVDVVLHTAPPADNVAPTVLGYTPAASTSDVATNAIATVTFSEAMDPATISPATIKLLDGGNLAVPTSLTYDTVTRTVTITPTAALANSMQYTIVIVGGINGAKDAAGNYVAQSVGSSFTTIAAPGPDVTPPTVVGFNPTNGTINVSVNGTVTVTFSEAMNAATINTSNLILLKNGVNRVNETVSYNAATRTATITPTDPLLYSTSYTIYLNGGGVGVQDLAGNTIATNVISTFTTVAPDTTPPSVSAVTPSNSAANVATTSAVTITFSEAVNPATVNAANIVLLTGSNVAIPGTVTYNAATNTATFTPTNPLANGATYTVLIRGGAGGVADLAGNALASNVTTTFSTVTALQNTGGNANPTATSIWASTATPATADSGDTNGVELGLKFTASTTGYITGIRFYKAAGNSGTHVGNLWSSTGTLLGTATFVNESSSGWQQVLFATPVLVTAGTTYVASYHTNVGHYSVSRSYFGSAYTSGSLKASANGGVYMYGGTAFPSNTYQSSNYWVDVVFSTTPPDTIPPSVTGITPGNGVANIGTGSNITVTFNEALNAATVTAASISLRDANNAVVAASLSYNATTKTVTLTPTSPLTAGKTYTVVVTGGTGGVTDTAGNALPTTMTSSFATAIPDTTPPTVTAVNPTSGSTNVALNTSIQVSFSEALSAASVTSSTIVLKDGNNNVIPASVTYNAANNTATLTPSSPLANLTNYTITVVGGSSGVKDAAGNALAVNATSTFTTIADLIAPTVTGITPASGTTGVAINSTVTITFSEALNAATVNASTVYLRDSSNNLLAATVSYNAATKTVTLTPNSSLTNSTSYTLTVVGGASGVKDAAGNAVSANVTATFSTVAADTTSPTVTGFTPANGATGVAINSAVTITFSEALNAATVSSSTIVLRDASNNTVAATVAYNSATNTVTLTPNSSLANSTNYTVTVVGGTSGVKDTSGNAVATNATATFSTIASDVTPPTVTAFSPAGGTTNVAINASVTITFSEALNAATISASTIILRDASNAVVAASISYNASTKTVTLTPTSSLSNSKSYTVTVVGGASGVKDTAGNALAVNATSTFTTVAATSVTSTIWASTATPATADSGDTKAIELGVKFTTTTTGYITGIRFYKAAGNTGTHVGNLWSSSGQLLATATFTSESASGWQQVTFSTPVAVTAGTTYVASYHTNVGHYSVSRSYFGSAYTSGSLQVAAGGGVYTYGSNSAFPTSSYQASNYWVDVVFSSTPPVDNTPPTVTSITPTGGSTNVSTTPTITVGFSEALSAASVSSSTITLTSPNGTVISTTVTYNAANKSVMVTPVSPLANSTTYTVTVVGGANGIKDVAGNALATNPSINFTTIGVLGASNYLWPSTTTPATVDSGDAKAIEVGVKFTANASGFITGIQFYKAAGNTGTHIANLWSSTGQLLATATFTSETASGWQQVNFATPVAITAGTTYVASYHTDAGHYSVSRSYFTSSYVNGPLQVAANGGVYIYGNSAFPTSTYQSSNYWVQPVFATIAG